MQNVINLVSVMRNGIKLVPKSRLLLYIHLCHPVKEEPILATFCIV